MRQQTLDFYSICMGPFKQPINDFDLIISTLHKDEIKQIISYRKWEENNANNISEDQLSEVKQWVRIEDPDKPEASCYYLVIKLHNLEQRVYGDFKVNFKHKTTSFYLWLNVSAILYNTKLEELTELNGKENDPIHFTEFQEFEETQQMKEDKHKIKLVYPDKQAEILLEQEDQQLNR